MFLRRGHDLRSSLYPKATAEKHLDALLGQVYLHSWCLIVGRHGGKATGGSLLIFPALPNKRFIKASLIGIFFANN